ncbi:ARMT1-like domain-containing protein [Megalodesulfovibrio paquesii]
MSYKLPPIENMTQLRRGEDPYVDAWLLHFFTQNNLEYLINPHTNASPEQLRFMVDLQEDQPFIPCSDELFSDLMAPALSPGLLRGYLTCWRVLVRLGHAHIKDAYTRRLVFQFARQQFQSALHHHILIPSRLMKRLQNIFASITGMDDPYLERKQEYNRRAQAFLDSPQLESLLYACPTEHLACARIKDLRWELDLLELQRLFMLSSWADLWQEEPPSLEQARELLTQPCSAFERLTDIFGPGHEAPQKILYLPNASGGILFDIRIINCLLRLGHKVILALKSGFYFQTPTIWDVDRDPVLGKALAGAHCIPDNRLSKNALLKTLRENQFVIIGDGSQERCNLYRTSVTFARAWKEADVIIAKGEPHLRRLIQTGHQFTRTICCFHRDADGFHLHVRKQPAHVHKHTEGGLRAKAEQIIQSMREAKSRGRRPMFYSAIIGSIPGQTQMAIRVVSAFVNHLRNSQTGAFIINPAEHFEPGLDGDDLMFMWELVQRSGLLEVWRFQTVADVEKSFELLGEPMPAAWIGKDATFSTGCTKEMRIALDMQRLHPELQIISPPPDHFFRRQEYGVGLYHDAGIVAR